MNAPIFPVSDELDLENVFLRLVADSPHGLENRPITQMGKFYKKYKALFDQPIIKHKTAGEVFKIFAKVREKPNGSLKFSCTDYVYVLAKNAMINSQNPKNEIEPLLRDLNTMFLYFTPAAQENLTKCSSKNKDTLQPQ